MKIKARLDALSDTITVMLIDNVTLKIKAGNGGNGAATFRRDAMTSRGGPDGGNGGNGGDVLLQGSPNIHDLREFRYKKQIIAQHGGNGTKHNGFGKNAEDITILVPLGTRVTNLDTNEIIEIESVSKPICIAKGGKGGFGNFKFKSATNQSPKNKEFGELGEEKNIQLELRIIAEIGLIGLPNAGKSSLLTVLTKATPVIGAYPFTTLEPNIGMFGKHAIADIPGLIEGASQGVGLGIKFLKHIEKTKILIHCIDITVDDPIRAYQTVRKEFKEYNETLLEKPELIFLNKTDLVDDDVVNTVIKKFNPLKMKIFAGSVHNEKSIHDLKEILSYLLTHGY